MARSPVFKAMLLGGFSEASKVSKVNPGTVPLPDDDCEAIKILARILHQETDSLPLEFDPRQYTDILQAFAYAVHKYDCANLVKPWGRFWIAAHIDDIRRDVQSGDSQYATNTAEAWLYIAYALDLWEEFYQISILFISDSFLHVNPFWVNWNPDARKNDRYDGLVPDGVMSTRYFTPAYDCVILILDRKHFEREKALDRFPLLQNSLGSESYWKGAS